MAQNEVKQSGRNYNEQEYSLRKNNAYRLDCHANRLARNDVRVANNNCMGICLIKIALVRCFRAPFAPFYAQTHLK